MRSKLAISMVGGELTEDILEEGRVELDQMLSSSPKIRQLPFYSPFYSDDHEYIGRR